MDRSEKKVIHTAKAPSAIGTYSQAIQKHNLLFISGQIPLDPKTGLLHTGDFSEQTRLAFSHVITLVETAGGCANDIVKINISLTDLNQFNLVNAIMAQFFTEPYPARAAVQVVALPKGAPIEIEAIALLSMV